MVSAIRGTSNQHTTLLQFFAMVSLSRTALVHLVLVACCGAFLNVKYSYHCRCCLCFGLRIRESCMQNHSDHGTSVPLPRLTHTAHSASSQAVLAHVITSRQHYVAAHVRLLGSLPHFHIARRYIETVLETAHVYRPHHVLESQVSQHTEAIPVAAHSQCSYA